MSVRVRVKNPQNFRADPGISFHIFPHISIDYIDLSDVFKGQVFMIQNRLISFSLFRSERSPRSWEPTSTWWWRSAAASCRWPAWAVPGPGDRHQPTGALGLSSVDQTPRPSPLAGWFWMEASHQPAKPHGWVESDVEERQKPNGGGGVDTEANRTLSPGLGFTWDKGTVW